jgi:hypothetical protein
VTRKRAPTAEELLAVAGYMLIPAGFVVLAWKDYVLGTAVLTLAIGIWAGPAAVRAARTERKRVETSGASGGRSR